jgi:signal transduction histidine kinase
MSVALMTAGWLAATVLLGEVVRMRRRLELVARAEHELRGPLTAFTLALDAARGTVAGRRLALVLESELARARVGLTDLATARSGRRAAGAREPVALDRLVRSSAAAWEPVARAAGRRVRVRLRSAGGEAVVHGDGARLAQALGNVMANAVEHGEGDVSVSARREAGRVRIEVANATGAAVAGGRPGTAGESFRWRRRRSADLGRGRGLAIAADAVADAGGTLTAAVGADRATAVLDLPLEP